jgi:hypothetical protein
LHLDCKFGNKKEKFLIELGTLIGTIILAIALYYVMKFIDIKVLNFVNGKDDSIHFIDNLDYFISNSQINNLDMRNIMFWFMSQTPFWIRTTYRLLQIFYIYGVSIVMLLIAIIGLAFVFDGNRRVEYETRWYDRY